MNVIVKTLKCILLLASAVYIYSGCKSVDPPILVPTYIHIDSFKFSNQYFRGVSSATNITNVWVYYNSNPLGAYDLPCTFPVMASGNGTLQILAGIDVDGLNEQTMGYPFYAPDTMNFDPQPGKTINFTPTVHFYSDIKNPTLLDDQAYVGFFQCGGSSGAEPIPTSSMNDSFKYFGQTCTMIRLSAPGDSSIDSTDTFFIDPTPAFIELEYKSEVPFVLGLQANIPNVETSTPYYLAGVNPSSSWKKFYLNVGEFNGLYRGTSYSLYIKANLNPGQNSGTLLLANVQLVQF